MRIYIPKSAYTLPWWAAFFVILWVVLGLFAPTDTTDAGRWSRSGMRLHVDTATGCHYLSTFLGGPTPRINAAGNHICTGAEE